MIEFPAVAPGEPLSISASLYATYQTCPARAAAQLQGIYGPESRSAFSGMLAHRIFAKHLSEGPIAGTEFEAACKREIGQAMNPKLAALQLRPSELRAVIAEVGSLYERFQQVSVEGCRAVELELAIEAAPAVTLRGRIDAVFDHDRGVRLVDWKTAGLGDAETQLGFYALLWALHSGELPAQVEAASISSGESYRAEPSVATVNVVARRVAAMVRVLRAVFAGSEDPPRLGGPGCRFCPLVADCSEGQAAARVLSA